MASILVGHDAALGKWAAERIPHVGSVENWGKFIAVGVATGMSADDKLMAVVVFNEYQPTYQNCQVSIASADPRWASKATLRALLSIPFEQYGCWKVWTSVPHTAERTIRLSQAIGFTREATLRDHYSRGTHAVVSRMLKPEYEKRFWKHTETKAA